MAVLGLFLLATYFLMAISHPILMRTVWPKTIYDPIVGHDLKIFPHPSSPSINHLFGTDTLGRDVLSILMAATIPSLMMAMTAALTAATAGTIIGALSAYYRGIVDGFFSHLADLSILAPAPIVMVVIGFVLDIEPFEFGLLYGLLVGIGAVAVVLRSHAITIMNKAFIDAARMSGGSGIYIITRHLVPHLLPLAAVNMLITVTGAIFASGFIAFLGLSRAQLNWGTMIYDARTYQQINGTIAWNVMIPAALAISLFAASFYFIALGLQDITEPRIAERYSTIARKKPERRIGKKVLREKFQRIALTPAPGNELVSIPVEKTSISNHLEIPVAKNITSLTLRSPETGTPARILESRNIAVLVIYLNNESLISKTLLSEGSPIGLRDPMFVIRSDLEEHGGLIERLNDGSLVAIFGLDSHLPPRACSLLAAKVGLRVKERVGEINCQMAEIGNPPLKMSVGISCGSSSCNPHDLSDWLSSALSEEPGLIARTLASFAGYMKTGGILICQRTYGNLEAVQHHFTFGRKGLAKLPSTDGEGMIYELVEHRQ